MSLRFLFPVLAGLVALGCSVAHAQVHRCVDEQGKVSFSDTVCNGTRAQKVFGANASAKPWQTEDYRPLRVVQGGPGATASAGERPAGPATRNR